MKGILAAFLCFSPSCLVFGENSSTLNTCDQQLDELVNTTIGTLFDEANARLLNSPYLQQVSNDYADFFKCLSIGEHKNSQIKGKFCKITIEVPKTAAELNRLDNSLMNTKILKFEEYFKKRQSYNMYVNINCPSRLGDVDPNMVNLTKFTHIKLSVCIPQECTARQAVPRILHSKEHFIYKGLEKSKIFEEFCRVLGDKPFTTIDYIAIILIAVPISVAVASTTYDVYNSIILKRAPDDMNQLYRTFSVYTNAQKLVRNNSSKETIECVDGIRALSMMWIISYHSNLQGFYFTLDSFNTTVQYFIFVAPAMYSVDTFFLLSGMFFVYSTAGKYDTGNILKNLPNILFNRLLRLYPLMCVLVLLQSTLFNHIGDGPKWNGMDGHVRTCRAMWWATLTFTQNLFAFCLPGSGNNQCLLHFWYLSVDMQLFVAFLLVQYWLVGTKKTAWIVLSFLLGLSVLCNGILSFGLNLQYQPQRGTFQGTYEILQFHASIYYNTVFRALPYCVGSCFGYFIHTSKDQTRRINKFIVGVFWLVLLLILYFAVWVLTPAVTKSDNQIIHNLLNAYAKSIWALAVGFLIIACHFGYGGPINWFLSLKLWKLLSKLSFSMYMIHYPLVNLFVYLDDGVKIIAIEPLQPMRIFALVFTITFLSACLLNILIEIPISNLYKFYKGK